MTLAYAPRLSRRRSSRADAVLEVLADRRAGLVHRAATRTAALASQAAYQALIVELGSPALATLRRVGDEFRIYVLPLDEDTIEGAPMGP